MPLDPRTISAWPSYPSSVGVEDDEGYSPYDHYHHPDDDSSEKVEYRDAGLGFTIEASAYPLAEELHAACQHLSQQEEHSAGRSLEALFEQRHGDVTPDYIEELQRELESKVGLGWEFERCAGRCHSVQAAVRSSVLEAAVAAYPKQRTIELSLLAVRPCVSRLNLADLLVYQLAATCVQHHCSLVLPYGNPAVERCLNLIGGGDKHTAKNAKVFKPSDLRNVLPELSLKEYVVLSPGSDPLQKRIWYFLPYEAGWVADILSEWWAYEDRRHHDHDQESDGPLTWFNQISTLLEGIQPMRCCEGLQYDAWYAMPIHHAAARLLRALGDRVCVVLDEAERKDHPLLNFGIDDIAYIFRNKQKEENRGGPPRIVPRDALKDEVLSPKFRIFTRAEGARVVSIGESPPITMPAGVDDWQAAIDLLFGRSLY